MGYILFDLATIIVNKYQGYR